MEGMMIHCGGQKVPMEELDLVPVPQETATYMPVGHYALAKKVSTISQDILRDYAMVGQDYALARKGNQMFALLKFQHNENRDMALALAYRNSYDQSMALGFAEGGNVFVCDNLCLNGDIVFMKKHTKNIWNELEDRLIGVLYKSQMKFQELCVMSDRLRQTPVDNRIAFQAMGELFGNDIIGPRQLVVMKKEWLRPQHKEFEERTFWSLYNAGTQALKSCNPSDIMEDHVGLHNVITRMAGLG